MSTAVLPTVASVTWAVRRSFRFSNSTQKAVSGKQLRAQLWTYPIWEYELSYEVLRDYAAYTELKDIVGFWLARGGSYDNWNYNDPDDNAVTDQQFGVGTGSATSYQLVRAYASYVEPVYRVNGAPTIKVNGVTQTVTTHYSITTEGLVVFTSPPTNGHALTWTGSFYKRVHFVDDVTDYEQFLRKFWQLRKLSFETEK